MLKLKIVLLAIVELFLFSCNTKSKEEKITEIKIEEHQHTESEAIQLNDGEKRKVNYTILLTSNCIVEGKTHDELHKWLVPYIELVDAFSKDKSANPIVNLNSGTYIMIEENVKHAVKAIEKSNFLLMK